MTTIILRDTILESELLFLPTHIYVDLYDSSLKLNISTCICNSLSWESNLQTTIATLWLYVVSTELSKVCIVQITQSKPINRVVSEATCVRNCSLKTFLLPFPGS